MKKLVFVLLLAGLLYGSIELFCYFGFRGATAKLGIVDPARFTLPAKLVPDAMRQFDAELGWIQSPEERATPTRRDRAVASCFGDSFTWGDEVKNHETWAFYLSESLRANVLNFGVNAYGTDQALLRYRQCAPRRPTPVVLLGLVSADMPRCLSVYRRFYFPRTYVLVTKPRFVLDGDGALTLKPNPIRRREDVVRLTDPDFIRQLGGMDRWYRPAGAPVFAFPFSRLLVHRGVWAALARARAGIVPDEINAAPGNTTIWEDPEACRLFFSIVDAFVSEARARGQIPLIVLFPTKQEMADAAAHGTPVAIAKIEGHCRARQYEYLDEFQSLRELVDGGVPLQRLFRNAHLSPEGNRRVASDILRHLRAQHPEILDSPSGTDPF